ncbi:hypothetical protein C4J91_3565 [Pseudomonas sp. R3-52-08]|nr:hypothetical protein C4J91_3565 [Pseudomonas sp. R3-52-08]
MYVPERFSLNINPLHEDEFFAFFDSGFSFKPSPSFFRP